MPHPEEFDYYPPNKRTDSMLTATGANGKGGIVGAEMDRLSKNVELIHIILQRLAERVDSVVEAEEIQAVNPDAPGVRPMPRAELPSRLYGANDQLEAAIRRMENLERRIVL